MTQNILQTRILAFGVQASKFLVFEFVPNNAIYSNALGIIASNTWSTFGVLQSTLHEIWTTRTSSTLETRLRYNPTDSFDTFPFPEFQDDDSEFSKIAESYHAHRSKILVDEGIGLTRLYNRYHDPTDTFEKIAKLRELRMKLDAALLAAYGWSDIKLRYEFRRVSSSQDEQYRFVIDPTVALSLIKKLADLNKRRASR